MIWHLVRASTLGLLLLTRATLRIEYAIDYVIEYVMEYVIGYAIE